MAVDRDRTRAMLNSFKARELETIIQIATELRDTKLAKRKAKQDRTMAQMITLPSSAPSSSG